MLYEKRQAQPSLFKHIYHKMEGHFHTSKPHVPFLYQFKADIFFVKFSMLSGLTHM